MTGRYLNGVIEKAETLDYGIHITLRDKDQCSPMLHNDGLNYPSLLIPGASVRILINDGTMQFSAVDVKVDNGSGYKSAFVSPHISAENLQRTRDSAEASALLTPPPSSNSSKFIRMPSFR